MYQDEVAALLRERRLKIAPAAVPVVTLLVLAAVAVWPTWPPLLETWRVMPDYSHGELLLPLLVGWIFFRSAELPLPRSRPAPAAALVLTGSLISWLIAYKAASSIGEQLILPLVLWSATWVAFGAPISRRLLAPIACLYFAIPVWEFLVPGLQRTTVFVVEHLLAWIGVPVHIDGVRVSIPEGTFEIASGCAGRRYFVVCLTIAAVFAGVSRMRPRNAAVFIPITAALALVTNWIRVLIVIYAGHVTNMTSYLVAREHISLGWALFALLMIGVFAIGRRLEGSQCRTPASSTARAIAHRVRDWVVPVPFGAAALMLCVPIAGVAYARAQQHSPRGEATRAIAWPQTSPLWGRPLAPGGQWSPHFVGATGTLRGAYAGMPGRVELFFAEYSGERRGAKLISSVNTLLPQGWRAASVGTLKLASRGGLHASPRVILATAPTGERWSVSYIYETGGWLTSNVLSAQLAYGILSWARPLGARLLAVAVACPAECGPSTRTAIRFWETMGSRFLVVRQSALGSPSVMRDTGHGAHGN